MSKYGYKFAGLASHAAITAALLCGQSAINAQSAARAVSITPPPMGWSSWNSFSNVVDSDVIVGQAKAMIESGMHKAGYQYINIDEGWWLGHGERCSSGSVGAQPRLAHAQASGDVFESTKESCE